MRYYLLRFILVVAILSISNNLFASGNEKNGNLHPQLNSADQSWYSKAIENIKNSEYNISFAENLNAYQSPNRKNNLRFIYKNDGFIVKPRVTEISVKDESSSVIKSDKIKVTDDWNAEFSLLGFGRGNIIEKQFTEEKLNVEGNTAFIEDDNLRMEYINNEQGMRQNFIVYNKPQNGDGHLTLKLNIETEKTIVVGADALVIKDENKDLMKYSSLIIWDANGKEIRGWFEAIDNKPTSTGKQIKIVVNDIDAVYPITIDPLSTGALWSKYGAQTDANLGWSVATAGDVNGDGYSDVIIGAPLYDFNSLNNCGAAFVYYGTNTGVNSTVQKTIYGNNANSNLGSSVSTAGDVNGDGYSDIIVGEPFYKIGIETKGAFYIYHGSNSGISNNANFNATGQDGSEFGLSVSTAGDVNGDGYSDIIVGAHKYTFPEFEEGLSFIYYGSSSGLNNSVDYLEADIASAKFGFSVSTAGDVNADGYSDVIVGMPDYNGPSNGGAVLVFLGSSGGILSTPNFYNTFSTADFKFGQSVATAGDVNGDGYSDVVVGSPNNNGYDRATVFYGSSSGINLDLLPTVLTINQTSVNFGSSVSTAGDINGDGYSDVIIGAPNYSNGETNEGGAFVYYGTSNGINTISPIIIETNSASAQLGFCVATAGDVNGDGLSDVIIGAPFYNFGVQGGAAFVYTGKTDGLSLAANWNYVSQSFSGFGISVSTAGDVNADAFSDVIIGAYEYDQGENNEGAAFVFHGSSAGLEEFNPNWAIYGNQNGANLGKSVSTAGDVNGDGYSDIIVGARWYDSESKIDNGAAFVYLGGSSGLSSTASWTYKGENTGFELGNSVSTAGDVNGDGFGDVIVGEHYFQGPEPQEGRVYVFHGSTSGLSIFPNWQVESNVNNANLGENVSNAGDVNGDGYGDIIIGSPSLTSLGSASIYFGSENGLSSTADWTQSGAHPVSKFGCSVSNAGDVNGDGYSDIIVGSNGYNSYEGAAYIYYGSSAGISTSISPDIKQANQAGAQFGTSVCTAGDVNGDGYSDILIGAPRFSDGENDEGAAYLFLGSASGSLTLPNWSVESDQENANGGTSVSTAGDVNGDGYSDILVGAFGIDRVSAYYGNNGGGLKTNIQQYTPFSIPDVVASGGNTRSGIQPFAASLAMFSKSPFGRADGKIVYEYRKNGLMFSAGANISTSVSSDGSGSISNLGVNGTELRTTFEINNATYKYKWRVRTEYSLVNNPYQKYGPWKYYSSYAAKLRDGFRTASNDSYVNVDLKVFLEGAYNTSNSNMDNLLTIPYQSPYSETASFQTNAPADAVDWVLVQLRDKDTPNTILRSQAGFLLKDGTIVDYNTFGKLKLLSNSGFGYFHLSVKHRNHLQIMTAQPIYLSN